MVYSWVLCLSLMCAAADQGPVMRQAEVRALLEDSRQCLLKKGKDWDDRTWSNVFEWNTCLEERLFAKLTPAQKMEIKGYLAKRGYYACDPNKQTFSNARKKIQAGDVDAILSVIGSVIQPGPREPGVGVPAPEKIETVQAAPVTVPVLPAAKVETVQVAPVTVPVLPAAKVETVQVAPVTPPPMFPVAAAPGQGPVMGEAEAGALLEESRQCLLKSGKSWDDHTWSNVYEWNVSLETRLFAKLTPAQKMSIKGYLAKLGYYAYDPEKQTFSNARKKIQTEDVGAILSVIRSVILPGRREPGSDAPVQITIPTGQVITVFSTVVPESTVADLGPLMPEAEAKALLEESSQCLQKEGLGWNDRTWSNVFEWNVCLEERLFVRLTQAQKMKIKGNMAKLGYYSYDSNKQTFSNARKKIQTEDVDAILSVIGSVILPGKREPGAGVPAPEKVANGQVISSVVPAATAEDQGPVMPEAEARALLEESRRCLLKKGKDWDEHTWSNVFEWDTCLEERLFARLTPIQKMKIKGYLAKRGYYTSDSEKQTFSSAKKKIQTKDVDAILSVIGSVILPGKP